MPAKNPRLTITLQPSLAAQLRKLSELTGNSQSGLIGDLLEGSGPVFDRLIQVLEAAQTAKDSMRGKLTQEMGAAQSKVEDALGMALKALMTSPAPCLMRQKRDAPGLRPRRAGVRARRGSADPHI